MGNIEKFVVTCKKCGSTNVDLSAHCGHNTGFAYLTCFDCNEEEEEIG